ncbi:MAG: hypothetical protein ACOC6E_02570 [Thermodesulfobacteriota bacterium]
MAEVMKIDSIPGVTAFHHWLMLKKDRKQHHSCGTKDNSSLYLVIDIKMQQSIYQQDGEEEENHHSTVWLLKGKAFRTFSIFM